ncbi:MAG: ATP-dependent metallopeptidase FtsH/Yme1/Tma family protein [Bdellovibrionaceae bacterium]|nr:ATP-dependent metallopeptidase FtsH/Yme1/Tma family protein [Pseudobdellovibrionaceae bacterium]
MFYFFIGWLVILFLYGNPMFSDSVKLSYDEFIREVDSNNVSSVYLTEKDILGEFVKPIKEKKTKFSVVRIDDKDLIHLLKSKQIKITGIKENNFWSQILSWLIPLLIIFYLGGIILNKFAKRGGNFLAIGKSKAKIYVETKVKTRFDDVAGVDEAKEELKEVIDFLKDTQKYSRLGGHVPKGVLLVGPTGTGKTLLAKAVAGEANVPFFSINGSEFVEMFVGVGAARVRDLFEQARKQAPCIVFIDELDALGKSRALSAMHGGSNDEKEQTLNQLLAELDGFDTASGVILLSATNRPEVLDPALLRPGRFDRQILVDNPDRRGREAILKVHVKKIVTDKDIDLTKIASLTVGFSGADLANLVNEAALVATRRNAKSVEEIDFTQAIERTVAGLELKKRIINPEERKRVAFHEMGHATTALALKSHDKVHKISIIPRGIGALGYTLQRPEEDRHLIAKKDLMTKISVLLGGRAAEQIVFEDVSTGAGDDLIKASDIARAMVTQLGMSEKLGLTTYEKESSSFLRGQTPIAIQKQIYSDETARIIDEEVKQILDQAFANSLKVINDYKSFLDQGAQMLLEKETLTEDEIQKLWNT